MSGVGAVITGFEKTSDRVNFRRRKLLSVILANPLCRILNKKKVILRRVPLWGDGAVAGDAWNTNKATTVKKTRTVFV